MDSVFEKIKASILSASWWKKHWYKLVIVFLVILTWILMSRNSNKLGNFAEKVEKIKEKSRTRITEIEIRAIKEKLKRELKKKKEETKIKEKAKDAIKLAREEVRLKKEMLKGDSEEINKHLNDLFDHGTD